MAEHFRKTKDEVIVDSMNALAEKFNNKESPYGPTSEEVKARRAAEAEAALIPPAFPEDEAYNNFGKTPTFNAKRKQAITDHSRIKRRFTRNTEHFTQRIHQLMTENQLADPIQVLMEIASGHKTHVEMDEDGNITVTRTEFDKMPDHKTRALAAAEILSYTFPKRKSVEVTGAEGQPIGFTIVADTTDVPQMPSDAELDAMLMERRLQAANAEKTIQGRA